MLLELLLIIVVTFFCVPSHVTLASVEEEEEEKKPKRYTSPLGAYDCILHLKGCTSVDLHFVDSTRHLHRSYKSNSHL